MKTLLCRAYGPPESLTLCDVPSPQPGPRQVVVDVKAAGVNFPDVLIVQGKYQLQPAFPFAPGGESAGVVKAIGAEVRGLKVGDAVIALTFHGAFAEELAVDVEQVMVLPPQIDFDVAAAMMITYGTSYHALKDRARLAAGETLLVLGAAGGVGLAAVELGKAMGARVIAAASSAEKLALCRAHGADETIDYAQEDLKERVKALTASRGVDVVYDPVGGAYSETALRSIAWGGRHLVIGFANGTIPRIALNLALLKGCAIVGVFWGEFTRREPQANAANIRELFALLAQGAIKPLISARYPLARGAEALQAIMERRATGKIVLIP